MKKSHSLYGGFLMGAVSSLALTAGAMYAQPALSASSADAKPNQQLEEVVITAQRRSERLQNVGVSVTAVTAKDLEAHRFEQISDLNGLAPNVIINPGITGQNNVTATIRGLESAPVAPGESPGVSFYLDGVYLANLYGNLLDLADVQQIEVLKGPQGTLFGRSAVGGAINIITSNPVGAFHVTETVSGGNYDQFRNKTHVELPRVGPFTANFTFMHFQRTGDIKNTGAGVVWDLGPARDSLPYRGSHQNDTFTSAKTLGDQNTNAFMTTVKFQPVDNFTAVYKYDYSHENFTPAGIGVLNPAIFTGFPEMSYFLAGQPGAAATLQGGLTRPKAINNNFAAPDTEINSGHNLTLDWHANKMFEFKDIMSYRSNDLVDDVNFNGDSGLVVTPTIVALMGYSSQYPAGSPAYGTPYVNVADTDFHDTQFTNELQFLATTPVVNVTAGWMYYHQNFIDLNLKNVESPNINGTYVTGAGTAADPYVIPTCGPVYYIPNPTPGGPPIPQTGGTGASGFGCATATAGNNNQGQQKLSDKTQAVYAQGQFHLTSQIDFLLGGRESWDTETFGGDVGAPFQSQSEQHFTWLVGMNYKPTVDTLAYWKISTGFIPGGIFSTGAYTAETATSYEIGAKADWFDHTLRTNASVFDVTYTNLQGINVRPDGTVGVGNSSVPGTAKGFEFEGSWKPIASVTLGTGIGYTDLVFADHNVPNFHTVQPLQPAWTWDLNGQYESRPLDWAGGGHFVIHADAVYTSAQFPAGVVGFISTVVPVSALKVTEVGPQWMANGRMALTQLRLGQAFGKDTTMEVALWVKNLTDVKTILNGEIDFHTYTTGGGWQPARTFGVDVTAKF